MEKETSFSHAESLALIESMINKATNRFNENGFLYFHELFPGILPTEIQLETFISLSKGCYPGQEVF